MKAREVRNKIIKELYQYMQIPVYKSDQVAPEAELPYIIYSITSPYVRDSTLGHYAYGANENGQIVENRAERAGMTLSFTVCSQNRKLKNGDSVYGDDEAMDLAERAQGWLLFVGREILSPDIVVESVENVVGRSVLLVDEEANRYGFDVTVRYIREDERNIGFINQVSSEGEKLT